jgi:hypothetical protein
MRDQRAFPRREVEIQGRLIFADGTAAIDCLIIDLSEGGARITTNLNIALPEKVYLWQSDTLDIFDCEVRWQLGTNSGLSIVDTCGRQMRRALLGARATETRASRVSRWLGGKAEDKGCS